MAYLLSRDSCLLITIDKIQLLFYYVTISFLKNISKTGGLKHAENC